MKLFKAQFSAVSLALLVIQLALVSSIAAKYLYERWRCPRVWTQTAAYEPELPMRGRYLSLRLTVDGCQSTLPKASQAQFPRSPDGTVRVGPYGIRSPVPVEFNAQLKVEANKLVAVRIPDSDASDAGEMVWAWPGQPCGAMRLDAPVNFYIAENAPSPLPLKPNQQLWIEVTLPPQGPPRPLQLALKQDNAWKPLAYQ